MFQGLPGAACFPSTVHWEGAKLTVTFFFLSQCSACSHLGTPLPTAGIFQIYWPPTGSSLNSCSHALARQNPPVSWLMDMHPHHQASEMVCGRKRSVENRWFISPYIHKRFFMDKGINFWGQGDLWAYVHWIQWHSDFIHSTLGRFTCDALFPSVSSFSWCWQRLGQSDGDFIFEERPKPVWAKKVIDANLACKHHPFLRIIHGPLIFKTWTAEDEVIWQRTGNMVTELLHVQLPS